MTPSARLALGVSWLALALAPAGCGQEPFVLLPGGELSGELKPVPADWAFAGDSGTMQLETRAGEPYSVNIAYTFMDGRLYINAGDTETEWVKRIARNAAVRIRLGGDLYPLRAERVTDRATIERFGEAWTGQSFFRRDPAELGGEVWIFELVDG